MAKLAPINFKQKSKTDELIEFKSEVTVSHSGEFALTIPEYLEDVAIERMKKGRPPSGGIVQATNIHYACSVGRAKINVRVEGKTMDACTEFIKQVCKDYLECETTSERVILYSTEIRVACFRGADGNLYANGYDAGRVLGERAEKSGEWAKIGQQLHATNATEYFSVGIVARVVEKVTYTRPSGSKVLYQRISGEDWENQPFLCKLNSFCAISMPDADLLEQMPYTEDAARFFYDTMIGLCRLAERVDSFFKDKEQLILNIQNKSSLLALPENK